MSYERAKQITTGKIPPWQSVLQSVQKVGAGAFVPSSQEELSDIPRIASSVASDYTTIPFTDIGPRKFMDIEEPKTEYGEGIRTAFDVAPIIAGSVQGASGIGRFIRGKEIKKVQKIQQSFGPWVKKYTNEYGEALRGGIKRVLKGGKEEALTEAKRAINPLRRSDSYQDLPAKTRGAIEKLYGENVSPRDVLSASNRIGKSSSSFDKTGALARDTIKKLKQIVKDRSPEFKKVDSEYGGFTGVRDVMEKFKPNLKGQGKYGTSSGTKLLRGIDKRQPSELEAMERFGKETGISIVGPAKLASLVRKVGNFIPWLIGAGGAGYMASKKLGNISNSSSPSSNSY